MHFRRSSPVLTHWGALGEALSAHERRPRRPRIMVHRSNPYRICMEMCVVWLSYHGDVSWVRLGLSPKRMYINRGNHETLECVAFGLNILHRLMSVARSMNRTYGFEGEAKHKHGEQSFKVSHSPYSFVAQYYSRIYTAVHSCLYSE